MINSTTATTSSNANTTGQTNSTVSANDTMNESDFMNLLIAQLKNQDPMNPMDGTQFASQLAQFSQLEQLQNLNSSMTQSINANVTLTQSINNTLAATLIGKEVKVTGGSIQYTGQSSAELGYTLPGTASSVTLNIYNSEGVLVKTEQNLPTTSGDNQLSWDFTDNNGNKLANDTYTYSVQATGTDGSNMSATLYNLGTINAVKFTSSGTVLSIDGTDYNLSDILEILSSNSSGGN